MHGVELSLWAKRHRDPVDFYSAGSVRGVEDPHGRSRYDPNENTILIDFGADFLDIVHEMVHAREARNPALVDAEREFFDHKTETHDKKPLSDLDPLGVYAHMVLVAAMIP